MKRHAEQSSHTLVHVCRYEKVRQFFREDAKKREGGKKKGGGSSALRRLSA
jgi:hypothetical protein